ncbi:class I SAM-dependent methyltransferase [Solicola gregarius]|uniref:Class I SAM-dependent methyltransferase n=1 Tax=Solicola gregarius TaxID=2908642 RepID=A0AA46YKP5_9ACTN|nr:class I SAM-dependent methyltransferase [Solicola gregarius]UYM04153.1 class I SAM-dependent methyltransferase [Solicola gregarius]
MPGRAAPSYWSRLAGTYDEEADHGLRPADVREAWRKRMVEWLPDARSDVADLGCGTGSLSLLAAELGHRVTGVDFADAMIERAQEKAYDAGVKVRFVVGDAATPPLVPGSIDVVLVRHVLWALPDPAAAVVRWYDALRPGGRFVLVEGSWSTGAGLESGAVVDLLAPHAGDVVAERLDDPALWGEEIDDERYVVRAVRT